MSFHLSPDQAIAIDGICKALLPMSVQPEAHALAVLTGSAGTGKTTVVSEILMQIRNHPVPVNVVLAATTHRAAAVMKDIVGQRVSTGHALFKLKPGVTKFGQHTLKSSGICDIPEGSIVIFDEASMIGNQFLTAIVDIIKKRQLKMLFVGDPFQLPPPTDICSLFDGSLPTFTLTQVHRQAGGNPILEKANQYREYIEGTRKLEPVLETDLNSKGEGIHVLGHSDFVSYFVKKYVNYTAGAEVDTPLCTFTNESAINYNTMVRKAAYFLENTIEPFYPGERLIANSIVMDGNRPVLTNNEAVLVKSYKEGEFWGIPGYDITVLGDFDNFKQSDVKKVFVAKTKAAADKVLNSYKADAIASKSSQGWVAFYELKQALADLRPPFAGTTHKAQGGTFPSVFIDRLNINKCRDSIIRARLLYVALTRASKNVYINS
jgi:exodeoxyribonuclease-5